MISPIKSALNFRIMNTSFTYIMIFIKHIPTRMTFNTQENNRAPRMIIRTLLLFRPTVLRLVRLKWEYIVLCHISMLAIYIYEGRLVTLTDVIPFALVCQVFISTVSVKMFVKSQHDLVLTAIPHWLIRGSKICRSMVRINRILDHCLMNRFYIISLYYTKSIYFLWKHK